MADPLQQARALFLEGNAHFQAGRLEPARQSFVAALALAPGRPSVQANLGLTLVELGHWRAAIEQLDASLRSDPAQPGVWLGLARCRAQLGEGTAALQALDHALERMPELADAWSLRGNLLREAGRAPEAAESYRRALAAGADPQLHAFYLAAVGASDAPPAPPGAYVAQLFDQYAEDFETHLVQALRYRGHELLLQPLREAGRRYGLVLDLGCGTGLCAKLLRTQAQAIDGVDLSLAMVERARASGCYRQVLHGDLLALLQQDLAPADLVVAADVLVYVGALEPLFDAVRARLSPGGVFAFTLERLADGQGMLQLQPSLRYAHAPAYVAALAQAHGMRIVRQWEAPIREDQGRSVAGLYCHLQWPG